ncbi:hypothetical protein [Puia sp.]|jgi:YD repeat-containing protein|uniref:hypothetical protein n=1 Tax=Puia sp. TaxID=2045100 RepID=UPI002F42B3E8
MSRTTLLTVLVAFCFFVSCKKNSSPKTAVNSTPAENQVKLYIAEYHSSLTSNSDSFHISYDNAGRLASAISSRYKYTYSYPTSTSVVWDFASGGQPSVHEVDFFKDGQVDSTFRTEGLADTLTGKYEFNGNFLSKLTLQWGYQGIQSVFMRVSYTNDNNGNTIKTIQNDEQKSYQYIAEYTYTDKPGPLPVALPTNIPVPAKNLPSTQVITYTGNPTRTITISYGYDDHGRLVKETDMEDEKNYTVKSFIY